MFAVLQKEHVDSKLMILPGAGHKFPEDQMESAAKPAMLEWFKSHLCK